MRILVLGGDGYLGWPTALHLSTAGPRRRRRRQFRPAPVRQRDGRRQPRADPPAAAAGHDLEGGLRPHHPAVHRRPDRQRVRRADRSASSSPTPSSTSPSSGRAPYSMIDREHAVYTQVNNVVGTLEPALRDRRARIRRSTSSSSARWASTARRTSTSKRASSRSPTRAVPTCCRSRSSPAPSTTCRRSTTATTSVRLPDLGPAFDRPQPGDRLRPADAGDRPCTRDLADALRLRRRVRDGAQPLRGAGRGRLPAHRLRQGRPDPGDARHPRHARLRRARLPQPAEGGRVPRLQPVHRVLLGQPARRVGRSASPRST